MKYLIILLISGSILGCKRIPNETLTQVQLNTDVTLENDTLKIYIENSIHCPLRVNYQTDKRYFQDTLGLLLPLVVQPFTDTLLIFPCSFSQEELNGKLKISFTAEENSSELKAVSLPFQLGKKYKVLQGYNGSFSHTGTYSKHAIDFNLKENDTICSASNGYVVGVIEGYEHGGTTKKWRDYANYITLYHPQDNFFTQYAHLVRNGSLVSVGDTVSKGQAIGLAGETGLSSGEHLHFNVLGIIDNELHSIEAEFDEGYKGADLKKGDWVEK